MRPRGRTLACAGLATTLLLVWLLAGCEGSAPSKHRASVSLGGSPADRVTGWRDDLEKLLPGMEGFHPDLYHGTPKGELEHEVRALEAAVPGWNDDQMMVGLLKIVARVSARGRDGHTGAFIWGTGRHPLHSLPLRLWLFSDGMYVVDALPPYRQLIGSRVDSIAGHPASDVLRALDPAIPRDNPSTVLLLAPRYLLIPEVLHGLGLTGGAGSVELAVTGSDGEHSSMAIAPTPMADYNDWAGPYGLHLPARPGVLYLSRTEEPLRFTFLEASGTLYVQYNRVDWLAGSLLKSLKARARRPDVRRIVVDIRHNFGGETHAYEPVVEALIAPGVIAGRPLFVITGRNTFSAASLFAARVERRTDAAFVGEPMAEARTCTATPPNSCSSGRGSA